ncbi:MAG: YezD family protein [Candidatus Omnitrophica bacterium]|nr:YezD family protein [Candidatus Omnitrophota bacterium]
MTSVQNATKLINDSILKEISDSVAKLAYGTVVVTVHNRKITQIEIAEKQRFDDVWKVEGGGGI